MKLSKKKIFVSGFAAILAISLIISGGTLAYLQSETQNVENNFKTNQVTVELSETTEGYEIIPGVSQKKDPTVTVNATIPAYIFVTVEDNTNGLIEYSVDERWTPLGDEYPGIYWYEVAGSENPQKIPVLKNNTVTYDKALQNSDMLDENGQLKEGITLTFRAKAIQKEPFGNPTDAYEERVQTRSTLETAFVYEGNGNFVGETFKTDDSLLVQTAALGPYADGNFYRGNKYKFSIKGSSNKDMQLSFDFTERCGANGEYKGYPFEGGFGSFEDIYALAGTYPDFETSDDETDTIELVGDYYPVTFAVTQTKGNAVDFSFTGSLTELVKTLSESEFILKAGTEYDEEFEITMLWPLETASTDECYILKDGIKQALMDKADNIFGAFTGIDTVGYSLWADFEIMIKEAN